MPLSDSELLATAKRLTQSAGQPEPVALERLPGGSNNRVFRVETASGQPLFMKSYFLDPRDHRQRLAAEWTFLTYAWDRGIRVVPQPLAADWEMQVGLYEFVAGRKLESAEVSWRHLGVAADFLLALNAPPRRLERIPPASEACFSLAKHTAAVDDRVAKLADLDSDAPERERVERFVRTRLRPVWDLARRHIEEEAARLGQNLEAELAESDTIVSPSDFGFHNMLVEEDGRVNFTDFEYAGRDDPAKLVCDFFCQPDMPAPFGHYERFVGKLMDGLNLAPAHKLRCGLLLDAYHVKWICIILNDFRPVGAAQRAFASDDLRAKRCATQIDKAEAKILQVSVANNCC